MTEQASDPNLDGHKESRDSNNDFGQEETSPQMSPTSNCEASPSRLSQVLSWVRGKGAGIALFFKPAFLKAGLFTLLSVLVSGTALEFYTRKNPASSFFGPLMPASSPPLSEETLFPVACEETEALEKDDSPQAPHLAGSSIPTNIPENPSIAIVLTEVGLMPSLTEKALYMPSPLTFAFLPYEAGLQKTIDAFLEKQHEVLIMIPMEPLFYPDDDPGPGTLLSGLPSKENIERLRSHVKGLTGYKGLMNYMGSRFTVSEKDYEPVLQEMKSFCEYFFDANSAPKCLTEELAGRIRFSYVSTKVSLDHSLSPEAVQEALSALEEAALKNGYAIAYSKAYPFILEEIAAWAPTLSEKNIRLVPLSDLLTGPIPQESTEKNESDLPPQKEF